MDRWLEFTELTGMRTSETTLTEAVRAYAIARMRHLDDTKHQYDLLDFVSFLEAIARLIEFTPVPTKAALAEVGAASVAEFNEVMTTMKGEMDGDNDRRKVARLLSEDPEQSLSDKLELMLPFMLTNMAISCNGVYKTKQTQLQVNFLTQQQRDKWGQLKQISRPDPPEAGKSNKLKGVASAVMALGVKASDG